MAPRIVDLGLNGMLVRFSEKLDQVANSAALSLRAQIDEAGWTGVIQTSTSLAATLVSYDPLVLPREELRLRLERLLDATDWSQAILPSNRKLWRVPACFDVAHGPQLQEAAGLAGVSPEEAVESLCAQSVRVMTLGFSPGMPYLGILPELWDIPRQAGLTKQVPPGAITVAIRQIVLFAVPSPTGWRQVGRCAFRLYRPEAETPIPLSPGDEMQFYPVEAQELKRIEAEDTTGDGGAHWEPLP